MIVEFSVKNFRSIKELQTISFVATGLKSPTDSSEVDDNNIDEDGGMRLLKTVGIYGANASGKSNIIAALEYFLQAIKNEASSESNLANLCDPFLYQDNAINTESFFQMVLFVKGKKYRYGFTVKRNTKTKDSPEDRVSKEVIVSEWLYGTKEKNMVELFTRSGIEVKKEKLPNSEKVPPLSYEHTLFLTHSAAFDSDGDCAAIRTYMNGWALSNFTDGLEPFRWNALYLLEHENKKKDFLNLLSSFNLKYNDIVLERDVNTPEQAIFPQNKIYLMKSFNNERNELVDIKLNLSNNESSGTQKLFDLAGLLIRAFNSPVSAFIIIDEVDSNFHPSLLIKLISLFNDSVLNKSKSQLLFTSHDTNLMSPSIMRRDQFYFTEKGEDDSTRLYSLADLKGIRNDADFAKQYLAGFYGALPMLDSYTNENNSPNDRTLES
ncbi:MAG TPA: abortive infection protein [Bacteroidales bacterium]|nr:abortive infection protein [Bacteroidales bacterium]